MSLLNHREHHMPFEDPADPVEADLRSQICRLHDERRALCSLIEEQRVALARTERELFDTRRRLDHAERQAKRRWWPR